MTLSFAKYNGTGNDFIIIDNRAGNFYPEKNIINHLCHRQFGIGADGLMTISQSDALDFTMNYYNSDGNEGSMCGNGGRCVSAYFYNYIDQKKEIAFQAVDGIHHAEITSHFKHQTMVCLQMSDVKNVQRIGNDFLMNTGSPHLVKFVKRAGLMDVFNEGRKLRNDTLFAPDGVNVNFVNFIGNELFVRTYERGVENETLSCGTGVTASAIAASFIKEQTYFDIYTRGGELKVSFEKNQDTFTNVQLTGPATFVYSGQIEI